MVSLILFILLIYVLLKLSSISKSIKILELELLKIKKPENIQTQSLNVNLNNLLEQTQIEDKITKTIEVTKFNENLDKEKSSGVDISFWFKENLILKIGVLMIIVGFGWFVSYAFAHGWIGPVGRITFGIVLGAIITLFGTIRLSKNNIQGVAFTILGSALVIITVLAGQYYYQFFSPSVVLAIVFLISVYISFSALSVSTESLAVYGLLISLFAPYFSHTTNMDKLMLFVYLLLVSFGTIWVSLVKKWKITIPIGITGVFLYGAPFFFSNSINFLQEKYIILIIVYLTSILYLVVNIFSLIRNEIKVRAGDVYMTIMNTAIILGFTISIVPEIYQSLMIIVWMLIYAFSGFFVFSKTKNEKLFFVHALFSILLLAVATSIELSGRTLVIAFAIESAIISISSYIITNKIKIAEYFTLLIIPSFIMSIESLDSYKWGSKVLHSDFAVLVVMAVVSASLGLFFRQNKDSSTSKFKVSHLMFILSTFYIYSLIWRSLHAYLFDNDMAVFISLFVYTIIGLSTHFTGLFKHLLVLKNYGMILLILVVLRLIIVDVWNMELSLRIITFIVLGVLFISTAFISKNQNKELIN